MGRPRSWPSVSLVLVSRRTQPDHRRPRAERRFVRGAIRKAWDAEPPALYWRFDLAYDGHDIKMLEYNADTPTALLEASVVQWYWLQARFPKADQFNSLHEQLIAKWKDLRNWLTDPL